METTYTVTNQELFTKVADVEIGNLTGSEKNISIELSDGSVREFQGRLRVHFNERILKTMEKEVMIGGHLYETIQIGNQLWLNENLKSTSYAKGNSWDNGNYGRLYNWDAAMSLALPEGWRLPSSEDWNVLGIVHDGWKLQFGGYRNSNGNGFYNLGSNGYWWSSTPSSSGSAYGRYLDSSAKVGMLFGRYNDYRSYGFSVRCVRDLPEEKIERIANLSLNEERAINFLKSKGYRILKPIVNYEEV